LAKADASESGTKEVAKTLQAEVDRLKSDLASKSDQLVASEKDLAAALSGGREKADELEKVKAEFESARAKVVHGDEASAAKLEAVEKELKAAQDLASQVFQQRNDLVTRLSICLFFVLFSVLRQNKLECSW
jgi:predicted  nucleic acid-binding Zn-ribbon protein